MIRAKKSLGQNFLIDRNILEKISNVTPIKDKAIVEVGPGTGNLTSFILKKKPKKMFVVEKDDNASVRSPGYQVACMIGVTETNDLDRLPKRRWHTSQKLSSWPVNLQ